MTSKVSSERVDQLEPFSDLDTQKLVLGFCGDYLKMYREAQRKEHEKESKKSAMVIGADVGKEWAKKIRARLADDKDLLHRRFHDGQLSTAVHEHAGHPKLFDLRLIGARREVCIEVQSSGAGPHKPAQKQAQDLYVREAASGPVYRYTLTASEIPRLERVSRYAPARDLSSLLGPYLK